MIAMQMIIGTSKNNPNYTIDKHRKNILRKLNFNKTSDLVKFAVECGLDEGF